MPLLILAALVCVYIILGVLYESFIHPLTILSTLPSAGVGALATLMLFGYEFSLVALIGLILLIGIVKKNGIMMVDFAIAAEREEGKSTVEAIREAALLRFRPIMMTTMAALLGAVPLMMSHGSGSEMRQPLGFTMFGGLVFSQALTLFTTPDHLPLPRPPVALAVGRIGQGQPPARQRSDRRSRSCRSSPLGRGGAPRQRSEVRAKSTQSASHFDDSRGCGVTSHLSATPSIASNDNRGYGQAGGSSREWRPMV